MNQVAIKILLLDADPIFALGFATAIKAFSQFNLIGNINSISEILPICQKELPDLIIIDLILTNHSQEQEFLNYYQQITKKYPKIKVFLLSNNFTHPQLLEAKKIGINGYSQKGISLDQLTLILSKITQGENYWPNLQFNSSKNNQTNLPKIINQNWLLKFYQTGLTEVNLNLQEIESQLKIDHLSNFNYQFLLGRKRELLTARWLINHLFPQDFQQLLNQEKSVKQEQLTNNNNSKTLNINSSSEPMLIFPDLINLGEQKSKIKPILETTFNLIKIDSEIINQTGLILEIDILKSQPKKVLIYLILNKIYQKLEALKLLKIDSQKLSEQNLLILTQIWQEVTFEFILQNAPLLNQEQLKNLIIQDTFNIQQQLLNKIPLTSDLLNYWILEKSILIDQISYSFNTFEANQRAEIILQNLIILLANSVIQLLLNHFSEQEEIKDKLLINLYYSSREMAKFRNIVSSQYRHHKLLIEPQAIFESKYQFFYFNQCKIQSLFIYYPRQKELEKLTGFPWLVTIILEFKDAITPILQTIITFLGKGLVFILTQIIGKGIGLVGKGILQGVGYSLQDHKK